MTTTPLTWAFQVSIQFAGAIAEVEIWYDSKYASGLAQAFLKPSAHSTLAVIAAGLDGLLRQLTKLSWHYEAGHKGNPWNEAADVTAKFACHTLLEPAMSSP